MIVSADIDIGTEDTTSVATEATEATDASLTRIDRRLRVFRALRRDPSRTVETRADGRTVRTPS